MKAFSYQRADSATQAAAAAVKPGAKIIVGGLALSQLLTLYTTPVVYIYLDRLQSWLFGQKGQATPEHVRPAPAE
jgi:CO/xanthine dehydrogenase FAD-binding subunit